MSQNKRLKLSTRKSFYDPIEVEINDEVYKSIPMTREVRVRMGEMSENIVLTSAKKESVEALYQFVMFVFNIEKKILDKLELREVEDIYLYVTQRFNEIEKERIELIKNTIKKAWQFEDTNQAEKEIEKNLKRPGDKA